MRLPAPLRRLTTPTTAAAAATATLAALLAGVPASADPADSSDRAGDPTAFPLPPEQAQGDEQATQQAAEQALDRALSLGSTKKAAARRAPDREATIVLRDLALAQGALSPTARRTAASVMARPTATGGDGALDYASTADVTNDCVVTPAQTSHFCVFWARETSDAPPLTDSDGDGVPNQVESTRQVLEEVWGRIVTDGGYPAPPADGTGPSGFRDRFDVYLGDIGAQNLYGYCQTENVQGFLRASSYCVLDDDFTGSQFPSNTPLGNLQVTGAHEFFHAVQFGIDYTEDAYFLENSSTWIEDELYDDVNDNRNYFPRSALRRPADPLDVRSNWYGNWVWLRFLTETFPEESGTGLPTLVREAWDRSNNSERAYSVQALAATLAARGGSFPELVADFATANRSPARSYEEGSAWPPAPAQRTVTVSRPVSGAATVDHLAAATVVAKPARSLRRGTDLKVVIDAPSTPSELQVNVTRVTSTGARVTRDLTLDAKGNGTVRVPFAFGSKRVDITLVNAGRSYTCWVNGAFSCRGTSRDNDRRFAYSLRLVAP